MTTAHTNPSLALPASAPAPYHRNQSRPDTTHIVAGAGETSEAAEAVAVAVIVEEVEDAGTPHLDHQMGIPSRRRAPNRPLLSRPSSRPRLRDGTRKAALLLPCQPSPSSGHLSRKAARARDRYGNRRRRPDGRAHQPSLHLALPWTRQ